MTVRAYMIYPNRFDEWVGVMDRLFEAADQYDQDVWAYICRHYVSGRHGLKPVEPEIFATAIELCKSRWGCSGAVNWVDTHNETSKMPVYGEIIKRANNVQDKAVSISDHG